MLRNRVIITLILICMIFNNLVVFAQDSVYPDYADLFLGYDKWENYNRKMFNFNQGLNKYAIRPIHILWSSIMPEYGMDRIRSFSNNIEYPIRCVSSLIQRDFKTAKNETKRFFINTTIGVAGLYDPARHLIKVDQARENMDQALESCKIKPGPYFVVPVLYFTTVRGLFGRLFDMALNPSFYIGTPLLAVVKACLVINRTSYFQSLLKMIESNYADQYQVRKIAYGIDNYIKKTNLDRVEFLMLLKESSAPKFEEYMTPISRNDLQVQLDVLAELSNNADLKAKTNFYEILEPTLGLEYINLEPDIVLKGYSPQSPLVDSMRTALFSLPDVNKSIWNEMSLWNRSFAKRIRTSSVNLAEGKPNYKFRYIFQHNKTAPLAIIIPSIGEGVSSGHAVCMAKLFYDSGYSVIIHGNPFQWEFAKSLQDDYHPGIPNKDAEMVRISINKIISKFEKRGYKFENKVFLGTSYGALVSLFIGSKEYENNILGNTKYIAICPPVDLVYAMSQVDKHTLESIKSQEDLKQLVGITSAKVLKLYQIKKDIKCAVNMLPFTEEEAELITGFIMHQKLSDLIFTIEKAPINVKSDIYKQINNMGYKEYSMKYLISGTDTAPIESDYRFGLVSISDYLDTCDNYKIYHSLTDYLTNKTQLKQLKQLSGKKTVLLDNGAHLGFLYRYEFLNDLRKTIHSAKEVNMYSNEQIKGIEPISLPNNYLED